MLRKRTATDMTSDDDDDDGLFVQSSGPITSIYGGAVRGESLEEDDDDAEAALPSVPRPRRKRRGRPPKMSRPAADVVDVDAIDVDTPGEVTSVFAGDAEHGGTEVVEIDTVGEVAAQEVSAAQARAKALLYSARAGRHGRALEDAVAAEAAREAAAKAEQERAAEAARKAAELAKSPPPKSPAAGGGAAAAVGAADDGGSGETVTLKLRYNTRTIKVKTHKNKPLFACLPAFCERAGIDARLAVMEVDGEEVEAGDTAETYDLEDDNIVDVRLRKAAK